MTSLDRRETEDRNNRPRPDLRPETYEAEAEGPRRETLLRAGTFHSLGYRDFRFFMVGALLSNVGTWMQMIGLGWLVYELTGSSFSLGLVNFLNGIPVFFLTLFAGVLADHTDRKRLLIVVQAALMVQAAVLGYLTAIGRIDMVWISGLVLLGGIVSAFNFPAWQATVPDLVPRTSLLNAIALNSAQFNLARLLGPMLGAFVLARWGVAEVFYINAASFLFVIAALALIHPMQERHPTTEEGPLQTLAAGIAYARRHVCVAMLLVTTAVLTVFGMPYATLMPVFADKALDVGSTGYSVLMGASGLGAVLGALTVASLPEKTDRPALIRSGVVVMGLLLVGFSFTRSFALALVLLALIGAAFLAVVSATNTSLQASVPGRLRGRVMALFVMAFMGIMPFSSLAFGSLGHAIGVPAALAVGGAAMVVYGLVLLARPMLLSAPCGDTEEQ